MNLNEQHKSNGKKIYIAGPMTGIPSFNFPKFFEAQRVYEQHGWTVFNPAKKDLDDHPDIENNPNGDVLVAMAKDGFNLRTALDWDTTAICKSDAVVMLPGWENSKGAFAEWALARALGLRIDYYECSNGV